MVKFDQINYIQYLVLLLLFFLIFRKMGEIQSVMELYVEVEDWDEAFVWADKHPEYRQLVYVPYATSLAEKDKFLQAQKG